MLTDRPSLWCLTVRVLSALILLAALNACREAPKPSPPPVTPKWMLGESFPIGVVSCRIDAAKPRLTELRNKPNARRVSPDVHVLAISLLCETADGSSVSSAQALPTETVILLSSGMGKRAKPIAPSTRTWLSEEQPDLLVFEVAPEESWVVGSRRYDVTTGQRKTPIDTQIATLSLQTPQHKANILLRERAVDAAFERALDDLMVRMAQGGSDQGALPAARNIHRAIVEHTGARMFTVQTERQRLGPPALKISYDDAAQVSSSQALHTVRLTLAQADAPEGLQVAAVQELATLERALRCERERAELRSRAAQAYALRPDSADCHVLGLLLPGPCDTTDPALLASAIDLLGRCIEPASLRATSRAPADFQLTLRRGRSSSALDRQPRYTLALFAQGQVVFHGRHWVNSLGRSDGRTSPQIINGLYAHMRSLAWFERKGGEWSAQDCGTDDEQGNVITLRAGERERMIVDRPGCRGPFSEEELDTLRTLIEAAAGIASFTRERAMYADPEARIWTVE